MGSKMNITALIFSKYTLSLIGINVKFYYSHSRIKVPLILCLPFKTPLCFATIRNYSKEYLWKRYNEQLHICKNKKLPEDIGITSVFASNELNLSNIKVYGFDYDYTIAQYQPSVENLTYELGKNKLVASYKYPKDILKFSYNRNFAVRGLHYDIQEGIIMKIDQFQQIQIGSVYRGLTPVTQEEVLKIYGREALPLSFVESHLKGNPKMAHLADLFSIPEMCLLRQLTQHFIDNKLSYHSVSLFNDVRSAVGSSHPEMRRIVGGDIGTYLVKDEGLLHFFRQLKESDAGLSFLLGSDWQDYFDIVITNAKKPQFFVDTMRPFREFDKERHIVAWNPVNQLEKGKVYLEGNLKQFCELKKWKGEEVLYFGDHPYSDLADVSLNHNWRTGAIIWELSILQGVIESCQDYKNEELHYVIQEWMKERDELRKKARNHFNPEFGSVFRTHDHPTYFSRRLFRFADVYTSHLSNLNNYSLKHTFYPRRGVLPHEYKSLFV